ncbi:hypothetical protein IV203_025935 [Nitzschia inconspicua]|uniref:Uncharacterized protein n=1 Tax=Nitzschia inconspicua TaxID=303405 RepID=A0A9K3LH11_9STRA|nr:hypothetical protein IV203_017752 [Nitzschia inconspicua]KAG7362269.1 hypothetical protein IV203_025935 [Nitzschia inconspicua]
MLAGPSGTMVLPLTDDAPKVTKEILGHALELTIHHPTIGPKICNKWITVDTIIDDIRAAGKGLPVHISLSRNSRTNSSRTNSSSNQRQRSRETAKGSYDG